MKGLLRKWKVLLFLFTVPLILMGGSAYIAGKAFTDKERLEPFKAAIVDLDQTVQTEYVIKQLLGSEEITKVIQPVVTTEDEALKMLAENQIAGIAVLPEGFSKSVINGVNVPLTVTGNSEKPLQAYLFRQIMESAADYTSAAQSGINTVYDFMIRAELPEEVVKKEYRKDLLSFSLHALGRNEVFEQTQENSLFIKNVLSYYGISIFVLLQMVWSYQILLFMRGQVTEGVASRLLLYQVNPWKRTAAEWMTAGVFLLPLLFLGLFTLKQAGIWNGENLLPAAAGTVLTAMLFASLFAFLSALFKMDWLFQLMSALIIAAGCLLGGHFIPDFYLPSWLEPYHAFTVNTYALETAFALFDGRLEGFGTLAALLAGIMLMMGLGSLIKEAGAFK
ncbi:ABC transporter permease [Metabacillus mangrovi]|uniref:ABC transporter permease n=1 Tax=Metabacillus mangrovi TaxID=1491830 RepID=UPI001390B626|nr:ABC transporter permease [Metabacillus mangrovi]